MTAQLANLWRWVQGLYSRYSRFALRRPVVCLWVLLAICVPAMVLDAQFFQSIRTGLQDLLPANAASVKSIDAIHARLGGESHLTVIAQSDDPARNRSFIKELGQDLTARHLPVIRLVQWNVDEERRWVSDHGAMLLPQDDFDRLASLLDAEIHSQKARHNPLAFDLGGDSASAADPADQAKWDELEAELEKSGKAHDRFPNGYFETPDGKTVVMLIWLQGSELELGPAESLQNAVAAEVKTLLPRYPGIRIAYNGEVPNVIEEHYAILQDLSISSLLVFVLVGALIVFYFRSLRAVLAVVFALLPGLACTFAVGRLTSGSLNSNSVFLGSIIAGNGINYPLILLAYFRISPRSLSPAGAYLPGRATGPARHARCGRDRFGCLCRPGGRPLSRVLGVRLAGRLRDAHDLGLLLSHDADRDWPLPPASTRADGAIQDGSSFIASMRAAPVRAQPRRSS